MSGLFCVEVADERGTEAAFEVTTPVVALDLALRAHRAGLAWRVVVPGAEGARPLALEDLRSRATRQAAGDPDAAAQLRQAEEDTSRAARAALS